MSTGEPFRPEAIEFFDFIAASKSLCSDSDFSSPCSSPTLRSFPMDDRNHSVLFSTSSHDPLDELESSHGLVSNMFGRRVEQLELHELYCDSDSPRSSSDSMPSLSSSSSSSPSSAQSTPLSVVGDHSLPDEDLHAASQYRLSNHVSPHFPQPSQAANHSHSYSELPQASASSLLINSPHYSGDERRSDRQSTDATRPLLSASTIADDFPYNTRQKEPLPSSRRLVDPLPRALRTQSKRPVGLVGSRIATHPPDSPDPTPIKYRVRENSARGLSPEFPRPRSTRKPKRSFSSEEDDSDEYETPDEHPIRPRKRGCKAVKRYTCGEPGCKKTFTRQNDVNRHRRSAAVHKGITEDSSTRCKYCGEELSRPDARKRHELKKACGKRTIRRKHLPE